MTQKHDGIHKGHRGWMRKKLAEGGERFFATYELLEMLLYHIVSYKDTNPIAKMLIAEFGDAEGVFSASREELMKVPGVGSGVADFLLSIGRFTEENYTESNGESGLYDDYARLGELIVEFFDKQTGEKDCVAAFLFDNGMRYIGAKLIYELDYASGGVRADAFLEYAISKRAAVVVSAHCHKTASYFPSVGDKATNDLVTAALESAAIFHLEHYIVAGERYLGIMRHFDMAFTQRPALDRFIESKRRAIHAE